MSENNKQFSLLGDILTISEGKQNFAEIYNLCRSLSDNISDAYKEQYDQAKDIITVIENSETLAFNALLGAANQIKDFYVKQNVYDIQVGQIMQIITEACCFNDVIEAVIDAVQSVADAEKAERINREMRKENRSRWEGGGFGLSGALKGAATAGALNAASGLGHSIVNGLGNMMSETNRNAALKEIYNKYRDILANALEASVCEYYSYMLLFLREKAHWNIDYVTQDNTNTALRMIDTLKTSTLTDDQKKDIIYKVLNLDPTIVFTYEYIFNNYDAPEKANILKIAEFYHIDMDSCIENYLLPSDLMIKECTSLKRAQYILDTIEDKQKTLGIEESKAYKKALDKVVEMTYPDFEKRIIHCDDEKKIANILSELDAVDSSFISGEQRTKLKNLAAESIKKLCTFEGVTFASQAEAASNRTVYEQIANNIKNSLEISNNENLITEIKKSTLCDKHKDALINQCKEKINEILAKKIRESKDMDALKNQHSTVNGCFEKGLLSDAHKKSLFEQCSSEISKIYSKNINESNIDAVRTIRLEISKCDYLISQHKKDLDDSCLSRAHFIFEERIKKSSQKEELLKIRSEIDSCELLVNNKPVLIKQCYDKILDQYYDINNAPDLNENQLRNALKSIIADSDVPDNSKQEHINAAEKDLARVIHDSVDSSNRDELEALKIRVDNDDLSENTKNLINAQITKDIEKIESDKREREICQIIYNMDIYDANQVAEAYAKMSEHNQVYLYMFSVLQNKSKLRRLRRYVNFKNNGFFKTFFLELIIIVIAIILNSSSEADPNLLELAMFFLPLISIIRIMISKGLWDDATIEGRYVNKLLTINKKSK